MFEYDQCVYIHGLENRQDLNKRAARVCDVNRHNGRLGVQLLVGCERVAVKFENLAALSNDNVDRIGLLRSDCLDAKMYLWAMQDSVPVPGWSASVVSVNNSGS